MYQLIYPALFGALALFYTKPAMASEKEQTQLQPLHSVVMQNHTTDWKQANQKVAELGGWQFYASEAGAHQGMDHSQHGSGAMMDHSGHKMPVDHSQHHHKQHQQMDHSQHSMPEDHSKHHQQHRDHSQHSTTEDHSKHHQQHRDHSQHSMPEDHSKHHQQHGDHSQHSMPEDHSKHSKPQPVKTGDEHEHHH
ncbi:hypothetical protein [Rheinheimera sp. 1928-s]|uniref:hypothetical protein n=1 Tax=Rheinheimera sp. 1928-s TaxID=3033803 RepID=UPI00260841B8|nr:hypothetical protein [Rheinheimera sp. 1928-s]MDF3124142.1 hypothetical protein [Rheinheimera sp. 1928-s]